MPGYMNLRSPNIFPLFLIFTREYNSNIQPKLLNQIAKLNPTNHPFQDSRGPPNKTKIRMLVSKVFMVRKTNGKKKERGRVKAEDETGRFRVIRSLFVAGFPGSLGEISQLRESKEEGGERKEEKRRMSNNKLFSSTQGTAVKPFLEPGNENEAINYANTTCMYITVTIGQYASLERYPDDINEIITKRVSSSFFTHAPARSLTSCAMQP